MPAFLRALRFYYLCLFYLLYTGFDKLFQKTYKPMYAVVASGVLSCALLSPEVAIQNFSEK